MSDPRLRLTLITDGVGDLARIEAVVTGALRGGCRCVQLRERRWSARELARACERLRPLVDDVAGLLLVNDRVDVAAAGLAHGAQVGARSLPFDAARAALSAPALLGASVHDAAELRAAEAAGCDFVLLAPVWPSASKPGLGGLGVESAGALTETAKVPVIWLGGVSIERVAALPRPRRPAGFAAISALMGADDPERAARALLCAGQDRTLDPDRG
ncbi:MAG: thiamine phosphate synthase [Planctomycetota bacterium]